MLSKAVFTVTIGNHGAAIALHYGKRIRDKLFVDNLTPDLEAQVRQFFAKEKRIQICVLIDIADQNYKKKIYPQVSRIDLSRIVARDLKKEVSSDPDVLKGYLVHKDKVSRKWECLFVSASKSEEVNKWIDFLLQIPNHISGIYMIPLEAQSLAKMVLDLAVKDLGVTPKNNVTFFITQNKVSGIRQIVFEGNQIVFTRMVDYDFNSAEFAEEFERDILRANEYLKRIIPGIKIEDVNVINILPDFILKKLNDIQNKAVSFINYSPSQVSSKIGFSSSDQAEDDGFSDLLIASAFVNAKKKILRFSLSKLELIEKFYVGLKAIIIVNFFLLFSCVAAVIYTHVSLDKSDDEMRALVTEKNANQQIYDSFKKLILEGDDFVDIDLEQLMDFGKMNEVLNKDNIDINDFFNQLNFLKNNHTMINSIDLTLSSSADNMQKKDLNNKDKVNRVEMYTKLILKATIAGTLKIKSGDVEELLKGFDVLNKDSKSVLSKYNITYDDLPKDLNFNKKYYDFPVNLRIESK